MKMIFFLYQKGQSSIPFQCSIPAVQSSPVIIDSRCGTWDHKSLATMFIIYQLL